MQRIASRAGKRWHVLVERQVHVVQQVVTGLSLLAHGSDMHHVLFTLLTQPRSVQKKTFRKHEGPRAEVAFTCDLPNAWISPVELAMY